MKWRHKLALGVPIMGAVAVLAAVNPVAPAFGAPPSVMTTARAASHAANAVPTPRGKPAFDATFSGSHLNTNIWATCYWWASHGGCKNFNQHEVQWYLPSQDRVSGGVLHLVAQRERTVGTTKTGARAVYGCRSGMITSYSGFKFKYGFVQVVASIPHASGLWPALWLAAANRSARPEVDMVESWGVRVETASFYHAVGGLRSRAKYSPALTQGWQTYSLSWTNSRLRFYVGQRLVMTVSRSVPRQPMYFIANVAEYQAAKAGNCNGQMLIRSVKIWTS